MTRLGGAWEGRGSRRRRRGWSPRRLGGRAGGSGKYTPRQKASGWSAIGVTAVLVIGMLAGYVKYRDILDGINHIAVNDLGNRPPKLNNAMNILIIGSDSRSGKNAALGGHDSGQRSDTVMIAHISPGHRHVYVLSFPRDTVVPIYQCPAVTQDGGFAGQTAAPGSIEQLNASFAYGGPGCLWKTLEHQTHIHIDDFMQLDFTGFVSVINALGGVEICLPTAIHPSSYDHLSLPAGKHFIYGREALEFWRLREDFGLGSDLQRIQRDQLLMVALVQRILKSEVLHSLTKTYSIINAIVASHALTTDNALTAQKLLDIGNSLSGVNRKSVQFVEVPTITYPPNPNWVEWDPTQDPQLWSAVAHDVKLPKVHKGRAVGKHGKDSTGKSKQHTSPGNSAPKLLATSKVTVQVLNGSGVQGVAGTTSTALAARGFHTLTPGAAPTFNYVQSVVQYGSSADLAAARTVAAQLKDVTVQLNTAVPAGQVNLILGSSFKALASQQGKSSSPGNLAKQYNGYSGGTNVCSGYGTAFSSG